MSNLVLTVRALLLFWKITKLIAQNVFHKFQIARHPYIENWFITNKNSIDCFSHSIYCFSV